jgi:sugar/nucleoside kinase (ribokinase family)
MSDRIVIAGNLSLDDTVNPGGTVLGAPGGDALYASIGVAAWGRAPTLLTLVGEDYPPEYFDRLESSGIDTSRIAATSPEARDYDGLGASWLHLAAMPLDLQEIGVQAARAAGIGYSLDPHEEWIRGHEPRLRAMVEGALFLPSELEARLLFPDLDELGPIDMAVAASERIEAWGPAAVAIKLGPLGSFLRWDGRSAHIPAPWSQVVDSTGAGDAFCGGFVAGWLATHDPRIGAACGTVSAGECIGRFGAFATGHQPTVQERVHRARGLLAALPAHVVEDLDIEAAVEALGRAAGRDAGSGTVPVGRSVP